MRGGGDRVGGCGDLQRALGPASGAPSVRGFDGTTITVAGLADLRRQLRRRGDRRGGADQAVQRHQRDQGRARSNTRSSPTTSRTRRPRCRRPGASSPRSGVFAIVGDVSANNPGHVLRRSSTCRTSVGASTTRTAATKPTTTLVGVLGRWVHRRREPVVGHRHLPARCTRYVSRSSRARSTRRSSSFGNDNESGKNGGPRLRGRRAGCRLQGDRHPDHDARRRTVSDYTPFVQAVLKGDHGKPARRDVLRCRGRSASDFWQLLKANGLQGSLHPRGCSPTSW